MRTTSHNRILEYFKKLADEHTLIEGFYRFNWNEIKSSLRNAPQGFMLLMESHAGDLEKDGTSTRNRRTISALVLAPAPHDDYNKQNQIFDTSEQIVLDLVSRINHDSQGLNSQSPLKWLRGFDVSSVRYDVNPGTPLFVNRYGYNFIIELPNPGDICYDAEVQARFSGGSS